MSTLLVPPIRMLGCGPGTPLQVEEVATNFYVSCVNMHDQDFNVYWYLNWTQVNGPMSMVVADCLTQNPCFRWLPFVEVSKSNATSILNIAGMIQKKLYVNRITCRERHRETLEDYSYTCNIIIISKMGFFSVAVTSYSKYIFKNTLRKRMCYTWLKEIKICCWTNENADSIYNFGRILFNQMTVK